MGKVRAVAPKHFSLAERLEFHSMPEPNSGCLIWLAATDQDGYGFITHNGRQNRAHRLSYELHRGPIAEGLVIDHLCRNPSCINPNHLEPVTPHENTLRGGNAIKLLCLAGHPLSGNNLKINNRGFRVCIQCYRTRARKYLKINPPKRDYASEYRAKRERLSKRLRLALAEGR